jgi:hypothetical protein
MKQLLLATSLCLCCLVGQANEQKRLDKMASHLNLSDEQTSQVEEIFSRHKETRNMIHEKKNTLRLNIREELGTVLSQDQLQKLDALHEKRNKRKSYDQN